MGQQDPEEASRAPNDAPEQEPGGPDEAPAPLNVRDYMTRRRTRSAAAVDWIARAIARPAFFLVLSVFHLGWLVVNSKCLSPYLPTWDPYPFTLLAMIASVEAPFLSLLILMGQHRNARIAELRDELNLQVSLRTQAQVAILLRAARELQRAGALNTGESGRALEAAGDSIEPQELLERVRKHLDEAEGEQGDERGKGDGQGAS